MRGTFGLAVFKQSGMALIISLIILLSMTLLGLAAVQNTTLEERMAGNTRAENLALQAAEAALRDGEAWLSSLTAEPKADDVGSNGIWLYDASDPDPTDGIEWWKARDSDFWNSNSGVRTASVDLEYSEGAYVERPRYLIEEGGLARDTVVVGQQQDLAGRTLYQLTSRGVAPSARGEVLIQSSYARRY
jgi:type IV pilus assembly protein PilX